jgi:phosphoribosylformylglycinamidine cyclo-ligase
VKGWKAACDRCGVAWGGGETPALAGIVEGGRIDLAASCTGLISPKSRLSVGERLAPGDAIVLLESSGIHANGLSLARKLAEQLPEGYLTDIGTARPANATARRCWPPPCSTARSPRRWLRAGLSVHYSANITGHGWRKLLRHPGQFTYRIHTVPPVTPVLKFMQQHCRLDDREAYSTLNMGAGFALFVPAQEAAQVVQVAEGCGVKAWHAGQVEAGAKRLFIEPLGIEFSDADLQLR